MGDGLYIFNTQEGVDNILYDLIDRYVLDALEQVQVNFDKCYLNSFSDILREINKIVVDFWCILYK